MTVSGNDIVNYLKQFIGTKYVWGGNDLKKGVDCSGLIQQGFAHFGIDLPRQTYDQIGKGQAIGAKGLRPGDLVFFDFGGQKGPDHVGIYMGGGKMLHAPRPGKSVEITDMTTGYWMSSFSGGRRIDGTKSVGGSASDHATAEEEVKMTPEELAASYGWAYGFLEGQPELKKLFGEAVSGSWSTSKFQAELRDTKWWKTTSSTAREAEVLRKTDPATYQANVAAATVQVQQLAAQMGAAIPANKLRSVVDSVIRTGMDENALRGVLGNYITFTKNGTLKGEAGMHQYTIKQYAANNGIELSDQAIKNQAALVVKKLATTQDFESQIREQAKSLFPGYSEQLDAGISVKDIAAPYEQMMSKELELPTPPQGVKDPVIRQALNGMSSDGKPTGLSLSDFQRVLRNDPRWKQTQSAQDQIMEVSSSVLRSMGLIGQRRGG